MMDLDELRTVRRTEREKDSLQHLRGSFYEDVAAYLSDLEAQRDRAVQAADKPFASPEVRRLTDEIETAREVSEAIYERRVGKIVKQASFAAADMRADRDGLTDREVDLFDDLVARIKQNKSEVLSVLSGEMDRSAESSPPATDADIGRELADESASPQPGSVDDAKTNESDERATTDADDLLAGAMGAEPDGGPQETSPAPDAPRSTRGDETPSTADGEDTESVPDGHAPEAPSGGDHSPVPDSTPQSDPRVSSATATQSTPGSSSDSSPGPDSSEQRSDVNPGAGGARMAEEAGATTGSTQLQRTTVRIIQDVGAILGADEREYDLASEDVVTLPTANAEPLVERDAAERLE